MPMKRKIFWIVYYSVAIGIDIYLTITYRSQWSFTLPSVVFLLFSVFFIWMGFLLPTKKAAEKRIEGRIYYRIVQNKPLDISLPTVKEEWEVYQDFYTMLSHVFFALVPPLIPFIYLFSDTVKFFALLLNIVLWLVLGAIYLIYDHKNAQKYRDEMTQERKEQEQREEVGKWK